MNEDLNDLRLSNLHVSHWTSGGNGGRPPHPTAAKFDFEWDGNSGNESTHQAEAIYFRVCFYIFGDPIIFHPFANDLEWRYLGGNPEERDNVGML